MDPVLRLPKAYQDDMLVHVPYRTPSIPVRPALRITVEWDYNPVVAVATVAILLMGTLLYMALSYWNIRFPTHQQDLVFAAIHMGLTFYLSFLVLLLGFKHRLVTLDPGPVPTFYRVDKVDLGNGRICERLARGQSCCCKNTTR